MSPTIHQTTYAHSERDFLASVVKDFKLSVTALNTYLRDPQEFWKIIIADSTR
jgi:hypothetical protein